jgi:hypothetical protein
MGSKAVCQAFFGSAFKTQINTGFLLKQEQQ